MSDWDEYTDYEEGEHDEKEPYYNDEDTPDEFEEEDKVDVYDPEDKVENLVNSLKLYINFYKERMVVPIGDRIHTEKVYKYVRHMIK